jgi:uncharacterized membrane protein
LDYTIAEFTHKERIAIAIPVLPARFSPAAVFVTLLTIAGVLLVLIPEFFYLRDQFGWRMNTIFKFYYQAWLLWGITAAFGTALLVRELRGGWTALFVILMTGVVLASFAYPVLSLWNRTNGLNPPSGRTLDGAAYFHDRDSDDSAAIRWLSLAPPGNVVEAVGPQYSEYARVATLSGQPTVLGWPGHESQWRGGEKEMGSRQVDIETLYRIRTGADEGNYESLRYSLRLYWTARADYLPCQRRQVHPDLTPVFQQGEVVIYEPQKSSSEVSKV